MKKIMFLSVITGLMFVGFDAVATNCIPKECSRRGTACLGSVDFVVDPGTNDPDYMASYICRRDECGAGAVVFAPDLSSGFICRMKAERREEGRWIEYDRKISDCSEEHMRMLRDKDVHGHWLLKNYSDPHSKMTIVNSTTVDSHNRNDTGKALVFGSDNICYAWTCEYGYVTDEKGEKCVEGSSVKEPEPVLNTECDKPGYEYAVKDYNLTMVDCKGNLCTPIKAGNCYPSEMLRCFEAAANGQPANWNGEICNCGDKQEWDTVGKKCVPNKKTTKSCEERYPNASAERLACCYAGNATTWMGKNTDTDPKLCVCKDLKTEWEYDSGSKRGVCKPKTEPVQPIIQPEDKDCWYTFYGEFKCGNGTRVKKNYQIKLSKDDLKGLKCEDFQERYRNDARGIEDLFKKLCLDSNYVEQQPLDAATKKAINNINSFFDISMSNRNVWRDEDGQFNTTRLASDATAGVVLGTVGGVVSANVIKKKQLEKGFDVLHCTVGGQKMADYGDTFQVSYQR